MPKVVNHNQEATVPVEQWASRHGLIHPLVNFETRETDVVERVAQLRESIAALRDTTASFHIRDLLDDPERARSLVSMWIRFLGTWPYVESSVGQRWVNPSYIHAAELETTITDDVDRVRVLRRLAGWGHFTVEAIAPQFGIGTRAVYKLLDRHDVDWMAWRRTGIRALARTLATNIAWGARRRDVAAMVPRPDGTVRSWLYDYVEETEWEPPADPSATDPPRRSEVTA